MTEGKEQQKVEKEPATASANGRFKGLNPLTGESNEPIVVGFEDVSAAAFRIRKGIRRTACDVGICNTLFKFCF